MPHIFSANATHVSPHLSWAELGCNDGTPYPDAWRATRGVRVADAFENLRRRCGNRPIYVSSGYRTAEWNERVGGSPNSQHIEGLALDLLKPSGIWFQDFVEKAFEEAQANGVIRGIGVYISWLHIDCRNWMNLVHWNGTRLAPEVVPVKRRFVVGRL